MASKRLFALGIVPILLAGLPFLAAAEQEAASEARDASTVPDGPRLAVFEGTSVLRMQGACAASRPCVGPTESEAGSFILAGGGSLGKATVSWTPVDRSAQELRVSIRAVSAQGASPLPLDVGGLPPGRHAVEIAPVPGTVGAFDQRVDWKASFLVQETPSPLLAPGTSGFSVTVGCAALVGCDPLTSVDVGTFLAPWPVREATLYGEWTSGRTLRWEVAGQVVNATSPLRLDLGALPVDEHEVRVMPAGGTFPLAEDHARWTVVLQR